MKKNNGVTIMVLVITVVILIILSSVTLRILVKNGIMSGTGQQREMYENEIETEQKKLDRLVDEYSEDTSVAGKQAESQVTIKIKNSSGESISFSAMIHIYNTSDELIKDVVINGTEVETKLPYGNYYLTTETAPTGYNKNVKGTNFGVYGTNTVVELVFYTGTSLPETGGLGTVVD